MRALSSDRASLIAGGLAVPSGFHALSVPVTAADAAGGVLRPGDLVDVLAVVKNQAPGSSPAPATTLGQRVLVLGLRTDQGQAPGSSPPREHRDRKSTRLNPSHLIISYALFCF